MLSNGNSKFQIPFWQSFLSVPSQRSLPRTLDLVFESTAEVKPNCTDQKKFGSNKTFSKQELRRPMNSTMNRFRRSTSSRNRKRCKSFRPCLSLMFRPQKVFRFRRHAMPSRSSPSSSPLSFRFSKFCLKKSFKKNLFRILLESVNFVSKVSGTMQALKVIIKQPTYPCCYKDTSQRQVQ